MDFYKNEEWKELKLDIEIANKGIYKISNYGRIMKCENDKNFFLKGSVTNGYPSLSVIQKKNGKSTGRYIHKLVAQHFLKKEKDHQFVIHLNYDKLDNRVANLRWATKREKELHQFSNPEYTTNGVWRTYSKLTETRVKLIKRKLNDPNRRTRLKMIAKQFGISEMQLYRIKTGENWGSVTEY